MSTVQDIPLYRAVQQTTIKTKCYCWLTEAMKRRLHSDFQVAEVFHLPSHISKSHPTLCHWVSSGIHMKTAEAGPRGVGPCCSPHLVCLFVWFLLLATPLACLCRTTVVRRFLWVVVMLLAAMCADFRFDRSLQRPVTARFRSRAQTMLRSNASLKVGILRSALLYKYAVCAKVLMWITFKKTTSSTISDKFCLFLSVIMSSRLNGIIYSTKQHNTSSSDINESTMKHFTVTLGCKLISTPLHGPVR